MNRPLEVVGTLFFILAVIHTFLVGQFLKISQKFSKDSLWHNFFHLLSEIEVVFAIWAAAFMGLFAAIEGWSATLDFQSKLNFTEPFFIFVVMVICSTRPILNSARLIILNASGVIQKNLRTPAVLTDMAVLLILGPLSGSLITEPAAMTVTASLVGSMLSKDSKKVIYGLIAVLFVNISIGGALTPFAAPPILMVASKWNWDFSFVFFHLGWRSALAVVINALGVVLFFRKDLSENCSTLKQVEHRISVSHAQIPWPILWIHVVFLAAIVFTSHSQNSFMGIFLLFLGVASVSGKFQDQLRLKESLLVAMFLGGIIQFGAFQKWWLTPLLQTMSDWTLFQCSLVLTAVTDNAALTFLGSQVSGLSDASKYALVSGAIAGGGLTVIANAPNAAGFSILSHKFSEGLKPMRLLWAALIPTGVAVLCLWFV